jgi:prefoldin subunit 5
MKPNLKTLALFTAAGGLIAGAVLLSPTEKPIAMEIPEKPPVGDDPVVQIALLLDTSNSMDGLIEQAKSQLWKVINTFEPAKLGGRRPRLQIAVYEYGNDRLSILDGYVRQVLPFTEELDRASAALFALSTNGGSEFAGVAINTALSELEWSKEPKALKFMFIAGNEPFDQGPTNPVDAVRIAAARGVIVNTIYCGPDGDAIAQAWKAGALLADGRFMTIDHDQKIVHVDAPQDQEIARLGVELNGTYIPFGLEGGSGFSRQAAEDANSVGVGQGSAVQRSMFKASRYYKNESWELGDAVKNGKVKLAEVDAAALPENMRGMSAEQREAYLKAELAKREKIQNEIQKLAAERDAYVANVRMQQANAGDATLDLAMIDAVRSQATARGYTF